MKKESRRSFVKKTAAITTGVITSNLPIQSFANVGENKKLKLALVGCGGRGSGAAVQALSADDNVELIAVSDVFRDRVESSLKGINDHFGDSKKIKIKEKNIFIGFDGYKNAIDQCDVVILTTPPGFRPLHFEYAIRNDKHVFMEKPLATDAPGVRKVLEYARIAKEKKLNVVVGLQRHYQNKYIDIYNKVKSGDLGKIVSGQVYWNDGGVWTNNRKPEQTELEYQMRNWYYFTWICGDHILEQHIHNIDVANWFIGEYPSHAQGMGGREVRNGKEHGQIFDHHFVEFHYPGGAVISSQCRHQKGTESRVDEVFQGTKASAVLGKGEILNHDGTLKYKYQNSWSDDPNPYQVEHDKLFQSIREGGVISDTENGAKSTLAAIMGRMATYTGEKISWDDIMNSKESLVPDNLSWDSEAPTLPDSNGNYKIPVPGKTKFI
ncbi:MAG: Gfo/Idh/MocA family protein [Cytophagales bacterium]|jgi:predicted dehydrogenase|tara:strand:- start:190 stop:1500 length:1311 start_codon:yes stop_codon:yes gene_type:complete